jgi:SPX domain protein involved in polyphosphate accumulation
MIKRFDRYELKYLLPIEQVDWIVEDLGEMTVPDPYGGLRGYPLVSLYYDSPGMDFFWAKVEGIKLRRKLRIRIYPADPIEETTHGMVEIKQRINRTVQKRRLKLSLEEAEALCRGERPDDELCDEDRQVAFEVHCMAAAMRLRPTCITAYHRKAFIGGLYEPGLRVTFDTDVRYRTHALTVNEQSVNHLLLPPDWAVMEVKCNNSVPDWVTSLLARHGCSLRRISKYCAGIALDREQHVLPLTIAGPLGMEMMRHG